MTEALDQEGRVSIKSAQMKNAKEPGEQHDLTGRLRLTEPTARQAKWILAFAVFSLFQLPISFLLAFGAVGIAEINDERFNEWWAVETWVAIPALTFVTASWCVWFVDKMVGLWRVYTVPFLHRPDRRRNVQRLHLALQHVRRAPCRLYFTSSQGLPLRGTYA